LYSSETVTRRGLSSFLEIHPGTDLPLLKPIDKGNSRQDLVAAGETKSSQVLCLQEHWHVTQILKEQAISPHVKRDISIKSVGWTAAPGITISVNRRVYGWVFQGR
jgi:hypothetical protein